jgi:hypothetical protein
VRFRKDRSGSNLGEQEHQIRDQPGIELLYSLDEPASEIFIGKSFASASGTSRRRGPMTTPESGG